MFWLEKYGGGRKSRDVGTCIICCPTRKEGETVRPFTLATLCKFFEVRERWQDLPTFQGDVCRASFSHLSQTLEKKIVKSDPESRLSMLKDLLIISSVIK